MRYPIAKNQVLKGAVLCVWTRATSLRTSVNSVGHSDLLALGVHRSLQSLGFKTVSCLSYIAQAPSLGGPWVSES